MKVEFKILRIKMAGQQQVATVGVLVDGVHCRTLTEFLGKGPDAEDMLLDHLKKTVDHKDLAAPAAPASAPAADGKGKSFGAKIKDALGLGPK